MGNKQAKGQSTCLDKKALEKMHNLVEGEFSAEEIQTWYKTFKESRHSNNRELTKDEFTEVYNGLFNGDATDFAEHVFRTFDLNNDGHVDFNEFLLGLCMSGSSDVETKITWAFKVYDIDGDGSITWKEMKSIIQAVCNMTDDSVLHGLDAELQTRMHTQSSRDVDTESIYEPLDKAGEIADQIFLELDDNKDGVITLDEFREGVMKIPMVLQLLECGPDD